MNRAALRIAASITIALGAPRAARAQEGVRVQPAYEPAVRAAHDDAPDARAARASAAPRSLADLRDSLIALARAQVGTRYVLGGEQPGRGFDCSGLIQYVLAALHVTLPRTAAQQARIGEPVPRDTSRLRPGDLLTFGRGKRVSHIGLYIGDGRFIHASTKAGRVIETALLRPRAAGIKPWLGARRLLGDDSLLAIADSTAAR